MFKGLKQWLTRWLVDRKLAKIKRQEEFARAYAIAHPGFQWIVVRAGTAEQARSPMLEPNEIREWFHEEYSGHRIVEIDHHNKIIFYE